MKKKNLLIFPITLILCFLFFLYIIKPSWDNYSNNKIKLASETEEIEKIRQNKYKFEEILKTYKSEITVEEKALINNAIPVGFSQKEFLHDLNLILIATGARMKSADFSEHQSIKMEEEKKPKMEVKLNLVGNYFQIKRALYLIENMSRLVKVLNFDMKNEANSSNLEVGIDLEVFYKKGPRKLIPTSGDNYFNDLLSNGLRVDLVKKYIEYRGTPAEFNFDAESGIGKEDLFQTGGGYEEDAEVIDIMNINIEETDIEQNVIEEAGVEELNTEENVEM